MSFRRTTYHIARVGADCWKCKTRILPGQPYQKSVGTDEDNRFFESRLCDYCSGFRASNELEKIGRLPKIKADATMPVDTIAVEQDGKTVALIENVGPPSPAPAQAGSCPKCGSEEHHSNGLFTKYCCGSIQGKVLKRSTECKWREKYALPMQRHYKTQLVLSKARIEKLETELITRDKYGEDIMTITAMECRLKTDWHDDYLEFRKGFRAWRGLAHFLCGQFEAIQKERDEAEARIAELIQVITTAESSLRAEYYSCSRQDKCTHEQAMDWVAQQPSIILMRKAMAEAKQESEAANAKS